MKLVRFSVILSLLAIMSWGCASQTLRPEVGEKLRRGNVATMFYMEKKKIVYNQKVYKVLWNEDRKQDATFGGFWDIDKDLTNRYSAGLNKHGFKSRTIQELMPEQVDYDALVACVQNTRDDKGYNKPLQLTPEVSAKFKEQGIDYLLVIRSAAFLTTTTSMFSILTVNVPSVMIIYDVNSGKEEYCEWFYVGGGNIDYDESPREIENNGLKLLKDETYKWLEISIEKNLPKALLITS